MSDASKTTGRKPLFPASIAANGICILGGGALALAGFYPVALGIFAATLVWCVATELRLKGIAS